MYLLDVGILRIFCAHIKMIWFFIYIIQSLVAWLVAYRTFNARVMGSNPPSSVFHFCVSSLTAERMLWEHKGIGSSPILRTIF